jgi:aminoglycoside phosphotransferase (APT) family kinase protein
VSGLTGVERVGETVRRTTGPWTPAVHALLRHLEAVGFDGAPRALGIDEQGREVLTFVEGGEATWSDDALAAVAGLVRRYHDAVASFEPAPDAAWQRMVGAPREHEVVCHNDLSPWNTIYRDHTPVAFIDWDLAAPGTRLWDVAWAVYRYVPLFDDDSCRGLAIPVRPRAPRIRLFCDAYGLRERRQLLDTICERLDVLISTARAWGEAGRPGWRDVWRDTRGRQWLAGRAFVEAHSAEWARSLAGAAPRTASGSGG